MIIIFASICLGVIAFALHDMVSFGKHRIVKVVDGNDNAYFKVQELSLLGYKDITDNDFPCEFMITFKTHEEATYFMNSLKRKGQIINK